jgi:hypothetical protein
MKSIIFLIVMLLTTAFFAQTPNWTGVKETNINVGTASSVDIYTNRDGNHVIVQESSSLQYYKMGINGTAGTPITLESSSVVSPSISGNENTIYAVYRKSSENYIRVKRSTDGGSNWSYITSPPSSNATSMESVVSNEKLHVTYEVSNIVYYRHWTATGWSSAYTVSSGESGTGPRITALNFNGVDRTYFLYKLSSTVSRWREFNVATGQWVNNPQTAFSVNYSKPLGFMVDDTNIIIYYYYDTWNPWNPNFNWVSRTKSNNNWNNGGYNQNTTWNSRLYSTITFDGKSNTAYYFADILGGGEEGGEGEYNPGIWRSNQSSGWPTDLAHTMLYQLTNFKHLNLSSAGNEVHLLWQDNQGSNNGNNLRYKWDNQNPIAPQSLTMSSHNNHPKLIWQKNPEPDVDFYRIYRKKGAGSYTLHATVSASLPAEYVDNEETVCSGPKGTHCANEIVAKYYVTAVDLTAKVSNPSNEVEAIIIGEPPSKDGFNNSVDMVNNYELNQNYPNPFNPSSVIKYQIPAEGLVSLKVYDILGREVAALVNEFKPAGSYEASFDGSALSSGVYFYRLVSRDYTSIKKMLMVK